MDRRGNSQAGGRSFVQIFFSRQRVVLAAIFSAFLTFSPSNANVEVRALRIHHLHTNERATIIFKRNGQYDPAGLAQINHILRDWRENKEIDIDPKLLDLIWEVYQESGSNGDIQVVCGYRAPETNQMLRRRSSGVAENSQHMRGKALDFYLPDVPLARLRQIGLSLQIGGVGYYPTSGSPFVHLDTGSVRHWPRMSRDQLVRVFPQGHTLHVPSDGKPLPGYDEALASYRATGSGAIGGNRSQSTGGGQTGPGGGLLASVFGAGNRNATPPAAAAPSPAPSIAPAPSPAPAAAPVQLAAADPGPLAPLPRPAPARPAPVQVAVAAPAPAMPDAMAGLIAEAQIDTPVPRRAPASIRDLASAPQPPRKDLPPSPPANIPPPAENPVVLASAGAQANDGAFAARFDSGQPPAAEPQELAFASAAAPLPPSRPDPLRILSGAATGDEAVPVAATPSRRQATRHALPPQAPQQPDFAQASYEPWNDPLAVLTYTSIEIAGWSFWAAEPSTRQDYFARFERPAGTVVAFLLDKPQRSYAAGFAPAAYPDLRTDRFSGALVAPVATVMLDRATRLASR